MKFNILHTALHAPPYLMVACHQLSLFVIDHVGIVLIIAIRRTGGVTRVTWLFVSNICQNIDRVVLGQAAESHLYWCVTKSKSNFNEHILTSQRKINTAYVKSKKAELRKTE